MTRPSWDQYFVQMAFLVATRGTCDRKRVGAVLVRDKQVVGTGYNGTPSGVPHCDDEGVGHTLAEIDGRDSCIATLHAESNALDQAGKDKANGATIYTTVIPCFDCAKRIINIGIVRVVYSEYYESRKTTLVKEYFERCGVSLEQLEPVEPNMEDFACSSCDEPIPPPTCEKCSG